MVETEEVFRGRELHVTDVESDFHRAAKLGHLHNLPEKLRTFFL